MDVDEARADHSPGGIYNLSIFAFDAGRHSLNAISGH
jgi:hypothetical protein